jgi:hypothetical protein
MPRPPQPIPTSVYSILGPVPVVFVENLKDDAGEDLLGRWCPEERCIKLRSGVHLTTQRVTLAHEVLHLFLWDSGAGLDMPTEERVCDALSAALVASGWFSERQGARTNWPAS